MTAVCFRGIRREYRAVRLSAFNARPWPSGWIIREIRDIRGFSFLCLSVCSVVNNNFKPDSLYSFGYSGSLDALEYLDGNGEFYRNPLLGARETLALYSGETQRHRIFAYCAESRSVALGQTTALPAGFTENWDLQGVMGMDDSHYSHSREFRSNVARESPYWWNVFRIITTDPQP